MRLEPGTTDVILRKLFPKPDPYFTDPAGWIHDKLEEHLWSKQLDICDSVLNHRFTAVQSCHGTGKSYLSARIAAWWIATHPDAFVVTSAPSAPQVKTILWREIKRAHRKGKMPGYITEGEIPEWKIDGELVAFGRKPADYVDPEKAATSFQGIHARYLLVILDEACGIPQWLWDACLTLVTNEDSRILAIGNPDDPMSSFAKKCAPENKDWYTIKIGWEDAPASTGEWVPEYLTPLLISKAWVEERRRDWGENSPIFMAKIHGVFPDISDDYLIQPSHILQAQQRTLTAHIFGILGVDVARFGDNETAMYRNRSGVVRKAEIRHKQDTMETADMVTHYMRIRPQLIAFIDADGLGAGVYDRCRQVGLEVFPFHAGIKANNNKKFKNKRAEAWWHVRELAEQGMLDIDPEDEKLAAQLGSVKWVQDAQRRIVVESKEDMLKRGMPSPDRADAFVMSCCEPPRVDVLDDSETADTLTSDLLDRAM